MHVFVYIYIYIFIYIYIHIYIYVYIYTIFVYFSVKVFNLSCLHCCLFVCWLMFVFKIPLRVLNALVCCSVCGLAARAGKQRFEQMFVLCLGFLHFQRLSFEKEIPSWESQAGHISPSCSLGRGRRRGVDNHSTINNNNVISYHIIQYDMMKRALLPTWSRWHSRAAGIDAAHSAVHQAAPNVRLP